MSGKQKGFTLIELMVTLSVLIIISTVGVPALGDFIQVSRQNATFNSLVDLYSFARQEAVHRGEAVRLCPVSVAAPGQCSKDWSDGMLVYIDRTGDINFQAGDELLREQFYGQGVRVASSRNNYKILIKSDGTAPGANRTFTVSVNGLAGNRQLTISQMGRARVY